MSALYREMQPKGFDVLMAAVNPNPLVPNFIKNYGLPFPVGTADNARAREFMQFSLMTPAYVPWNVFIDRQGVIRYQHSGNDAYFFSEDRSAREIVTKLLAEKTALAAKPARKPVTRNAAK